LILKTEPAELQQADLGVDTRKNWQEDLEKTFAQTALTATLVTTAKEWK
jgi:hypothetical protein